MIKKISAVCLCLVGILLFLNGAYAANPAYIIIGPYPMKPVKMANPQTVILIQDRQEIEKIVRLFKENKMVGHYCGYHWAVSYWNSPTERTDKIGINDECENPAILKGLSPYLEVLTSGVAQYQYTITVPSDIAPSTAIFNLSKEGVTPFFGGKGLDYLASATIHYYRNLPPDHAYSCKNNSVFNRELKAIQSAIEKQYLGVKVDIQNHHEGGSLEFEICSPEIILTFPSGKLPPNVKGELYKIVTRVKKVVPDWRVLLNNAYRRQDNVPPHCDCYDTAKDGYAVYSHLIVPYEQWEQPHQQIVLSVHYTRFLPLENGKCEGGAIFKKESGLLASKISQVFGVKVEAQNQTYSYGDSSMTCDATIHIPLSSKSDTKRMDNQISEFAKAIPKKIPMDEDVKWFARDFEHAPSYGCDCQHTFADKGYAAEVQTRVPQKYNIYIVAPRKMSPDDLKTLQSKLSGKNS